MRRRNLRPQDLRDDGGLLAHRRRPTQRLRARQGPLAWVNAAEKFIVSRSLQSAPWGSLGDCTVVGDIRDFAEIKDRAGGDIVLIGSIDTAGAMIDAGLVDEYYLTLNPAILGGGRRLFDDIHNKIDLRLADSQTFSTGVVACHYVEGVTPLRPVGGGMLRRGRSTRT